MKNETILLRKICFCFVVCLNDRFVSKLITVHRTVAILRKAKSMSPWNPVHMQPTNLAHAVALAANL